MWKGKSIYLFQVEPLSITVNCHVHPNGCLNLLHSLQWQVAKLSAAKLQECSAIFREEYFSLKHFNISIHGADMISLKVCSNFHTDDDGALSGRCTFWTI